MRLFWFAISCWGCGAPSAAALVLDGPDVVRVTSTGPVSGLPQVRDADGQSVEGVEWRVDREEVARWEDGQLLAVGEGDATVIGRWQGQEVRYRVEVQPALLLRFDAPPDTLTVGQRVTLTLHAHRGAEDGPAPTLRWTSSAPDVLTVDASGTVSALREGVAYVTAQGANGDAVVEIRVSRAP